MSDPDHSSETRARQLAGTLGLNNLKPEHLQQLLKAEKVSAARRALMDTASLTPADEPAHVYRLP